MLLISGYNDDLFIKQVKKSIVSHNIIFNIYILNIYIYYVHTVPTPQVKWVLPFVKVPYRDNKYIVLSLHSV